MKKFFFFEFSIYLCRIFFSGKVIENILTRPTGKKNNMFLLIIKTVLDSRSK